MLLMLLLVTLLSVECKQYKLRTPAHLEEGDQRSAHVVPRRLDRPPLPVGLAHLVEAVSHHRSTHCRQGQAGRAAGGGLGCGGGGAGNEAGGLYGKWLCAAPRRAVPPTALPHLQRG